MTKLQAQIDFINSLLELSATGELNIITPMGRNGWRDTDTRFLKGVKKSLEDLLSARSAGGKVRAAQIKYATEAERKAARVKSQQEYLNRKKA